MKGSPEQKSSKILAKSITENQRAEVLLKDTVNLTKGGGKPGQGYPAVLIYSVEDSHVKTSPLQEKELDLQANGQDFSMSLRELQMSQSGMEDSSLLKMYRASSHRMKVKTLESSAKRFTNSGLMISPGELLIANISESPSVVGEFLSLEDVLEDEVALKYFLSQKAAKGILNRAAKRGRKIPEFLYRALVMVAQTTTTPKQED